MKNVQSEFKEVLQHYIKLAAIFMEKNPQILLYKYLGDLGTAAKVWHVWYDFNIMKPSIQLYFGITSMKEVHFH